MMTRFCNCCKNDVIITRFFYDVRMMSLLLNKTRFLYIIVVRMMSLLPNEGPLLCFFLFSLESGMVEL